MAVDVVSLLDEEWSALGELAASLDPQDWQAATECPGWSVRDVFAHVVGTEKGLVGESGPPPAPEGLPHVHNPIGAFNESWVVALRALPTSDLLDAYRSVVSRRLEQLRAMTAEDLERVGPSPVGQAPYREFMAVRVMDCWVHEQDIRVALGRPGHREGPVAELSMGRIVSAMPFVVGKRAGAGEGQSVRFAISGPTARTVDVVVRDGRAALRPVDGEPTAEIRLDAEVFWRLGCGRLAGDAARGGGLVEMVGDGELATAVVDGMAFMI